MVLAIRLSGVEEDSSQVRATQTTGPALVDKKDKLDRSQFFILVSETNSDIAILIGASLERIGYLVTTITRRDLALPLFEAGEGRYNLVIANEGEGGLGFIDAVKEASPDTPILLCTGNSVAQKGKADAVLYKPFTQDQLQNTVDSLLGFEQK